MKIEWLVANATPVGSPDRAGRDTLGTSFNVFWEIRATFVVEDPLCDVGIRSWTQTTLLRTI